MSGSDYTIEDQLRMSRAVNYFEWQARLVLPEIGQRVLEVGCGLGNFTGRMLDRELVVAIDPEAGCIERLHARYAGHANVHARVGEAGGADFGALAEWACDSCVCLNVLEHIADDRGALEAIAGALTASGRIALLVPAFPALYGPIDRRLDHQRRYTPFTLRNVAEKAGLAVRKLHFVNLVGFFGWWANSHLFRREVQSEAQIAVFDRWVVPVMSRVERVIKPPFGQSLFAVLERR